MKKTSQHMKKMRILIPLLFLALAALCLNLFYEVFTGRMTANTDDEEVVTVLELVYAYQNPQWNTAIENVIEEFEEYGLEEPETYDDFLQICKTLKRKGITSIGVGGADLWHMEYWVNHFFHTDVLTVESDWLEKCSLGEVSWTAVAIEQLNPDMELGWFYVPPDEAGIVYATDNLDTFWSVTAECAADEKKYEAAMTFLRWFYSDEIYLSFCETSCTFPLTDLEPDFETGSVYEEVWEAFQSADERVSADFVHAVFYSYERTDEKTQGSDG